MTTPAPDPVSGGSDSIVSADPKGWRKRLRGSPLNSAGLDRQHFRVDRLDEDHGEVASAITTIVTFLVGYLVPESM